MFKSSLFTINYYMEPLCNNWLEKKQQITDILNAYPEVKQPNTHFASNRQYNRDGLREAFLNIFNEEITKFQAQIQQEIIIEDIWSVLYVKDDFHIPHNHGSTGYAGLVYLDFDNQSSNTYYLQPWNNLTTDHTDISFLNIREGSMVIMPKFITHYTLPHKSTNPKRILSFDMKCRT